MRKSIFLVVIVLIFVGAILLLPGRTIEQGQPQGSEESGGTISEDELLKQEKLKEAGSYNEFNGKPADLDEEVNVEQLANPASVYCVGQGGDSKNGICVFEDGSECDEWAFFRGECK